MFGGYQQLGNQAGFGNYGGSLGGTGASPWGFGVPNYSNFNTPNYFSAATPRYDGSAATGYGGFDAFGGYGRVFGSPYGYGPR
ncbi:unnamed protein product [Rotaria sp. Silwood1]|nr:unnamed protein product [Rotaria sp. Silwood1]CAF1317152.1 unnamed protein product [Rotaria sp. Silwood1]CAF1320205.1 unnamed protein product [Rotaria sp. Silwood1]CAF3509199.1 unnamed protein product [Rotaria sp. Silwood1]CAF3588414.1 unnamed protein product [Rotaria sp. Silwood1]